MFMCLFIFIESTALSNLAVNNKKFAELWGELSDEQKTKYTEKAAAASSGTTEVNVKRECKKIYNLLRDVVNCCITYICTVAILIPVGLWTRRMQA